MDIVSFLSDHEKAVAEDFVDALKGKYLLCINYDGLAKVVEVHAVGVSTAGNACSRVWQITGESTEANTVGWKLLDLNKVLNLSEFNMPSKSPREGYKPGDKAMVKILYQL